MSSHVATLKRGAILASIVVSSYAVFGHDAWAPEPVVTDESLGETTGTSASAHYVNSLEPTRVIRWPESWTPSSSLQGGTACSPYVLPAGSVSLWSIQRQGNYARCTSGGAIWSPTEGARLDAGLSGTGSTAPATTLENGEATTVVQVPPTWTYNTTLAAGTYCTTWAAPAGTVVGTIIVRSGTYAKCGY